MRVKINLRKNKVSGGRKLKTITLSMNESEYVYLQEKAHGNGINTPNYIYHLLKYGMSRDGWLQSRPYFEDIDGDSDGSDFFDT